jgi:hypothetical protein
MRILGLLRADADSEAGAPPSQELIERMGAFISEVVDAGIFIAGDGLTPSAKGKRMKRSNGATTVIDGPFTESKELIASFTIMKVDSWEQAEYWCSRFLEVIGEGEVELRPIFEPEDFSEDVFTPEARAHEAAWRERAEKNQ